MKKQLQKYYALAKSNIFSLSGMTEKMAKNLNYIFKKIAIQPRTTDYGHPMKA